MPACSASTRQLIFRWNCVNGPTNMAALNWCRHASPVRRESHPIVRFLIRGRIRTISCSIRKSAPVVRCDRAARLDMRMAGRSGRPAVFSSILLKVAGWNLLRADSLRSLVTKLTKTGQVWGSVMPCSDIWTTLQRVGPVPDPHRRLTTPSPKKSTDPHTNVTDFCRTCPS